ncbi:MAG: RdgB/HAM1 family non-canonical purine NTP pyrophosphatase [Bacteroidales bacterium]|nr:RdgB/HAM1 family non-canonical purine NTP pyrophosphatase [Bacteroidales bacterium]
MKLIFVTNNFHKLEEAWEILKDCQIEVLSLKDIGLEVPIEETGDTFDQNAMIKAQTIYQLVGLDCFADDSGLEVMALNNEPGVWSSCYAGEEGNSDKNISKLLRRLEGIENRKARFVTVICFIWRGNSYFFKGEVYGQIIRERRGKGGFGYDSVFVPEGYDRTFAEMTMEEKNNISHRKKALMAMRTFIEKEIGKY